MTLTLEAAVTAPEAVAQAKSTAPGEAAVATSVSKALRLLNVFCSSGPVLGVSELARKAGIPKSTAFRLLAYLDGASLIEREGTGYRLSWHAFELGSAAQHRWPAGLREISAPWLSEIYVRSRGVAHLAVLDGADVLYLDKVAGPKSPRVDTAVGRRFPAHCTGLGKAILAFSDPSVIARIVERGLPARTRYSISESSRFVSELRRIRVAGVATDREEGALGVACVAAPILVGSDAVASISVSGQSQNFDWNGNTALVRAAARRIALGLGSGAAKAVAGL